MIKIIYRVFTLLNKEKKAAIRVVLSSFVFSGLVLVEPILYGKIIDTLVSFKSDESGTFADLFGVMKIWLVLGLCIIVLKLFISITSDTLSHRNFHVNIKKFYEKILDLSMYFHSNSNSGELVKKITKGSDQIFMTNHDMFRRTFAELFTIIVLIPLVLYLNLKLGLFVIGLGIISSLIVYSVASQVAVKQHKIEKFYTEMSSLYADTFSNINIVKSFGLKSDRVARLKSISDKTFKSQFPILKLWGFLDSFSKILNTVIFLGIIAYGTNLFFSGESTIGEIVMFLSFSSILLSAIETLTWAYQDFFWRMPSIKDFFEIMDKQIKVTDKDNAMVMPKVKGSLVFDNVTFSYDGKRDVLKNITLSVKPGEKVAFVGQTGSGKTTMTNLILRFYEQQAGSIVIDGIDISDVTQESLRRNIGVVFQDSSMFNASIIDNIKLDKEYATKQEIDEVAKSAHAYDFIQKLPDGFDTIVGERGVKLSGGEKQRLAIARTLLKDAPILILDEATSALDTETEKYLQESFEILMKGRTTFIIAHRLSTIRKADRIFVFKDGEIVENGTYRELKKLGGSFARLIEAQTDGFVD